MHFSAFEWSHQVGLTEGPRGLRVDFLLEMFDVTFMQRVYPADQRAVRLCPRDESGAAWRCHNERLRERDQRYRSSVFEELQTMIRETDHRESTVRSPSDASAIRHS